MTRDHDNSCHYIEDTLLLEFLIKRFSEMLQVEKPTHAPVWSGLGLVGLNQNKEFQNAFKTMISSESYTIKEVLASSIDLFLGELARLEAIDTTDYLEKKVERPPLNPRTARKLLFWSWAEGRKMSIKRDFRFYPVWDVVSWLGLSSDEYISAFEEKCRFSDSPVEVKLEDGLDVVKAAIFRRRIDGTSVQWDMLKTGTTPIDKETQE